MDTASVVPHGVPSSTRDGWSSIEHRVLKRRASVARGPRRRRRRLGSPVRDAFETWRRGAGAVCLALDSAIVGFTTALMTVALARTEAPVGGAAILLGAFAAAGYAVAVATRPAVRADPRGSDALFLGGVLVLCLSAAGEAARQIGLGAPSFLAAPGVALFGTLGLA